MLINGTLQVNGTTLKDVPIIENIKEILSRILLVTAGFYNCVKKEDFTSYISTDNPNIRLSIYLQDARCYLGSYNTQSKEVSTNINNEDIIMITDDHIDAYITKLCRAEDYYLKHGELPFVMHDARMKSKWLKIIDQMEKAGVDKPIRFAEILQDNNIPFVYNYWEAAKSKDKRAIQLQLVNDNLDISFDR